MKPRNNYESYKKVLSKDAFYAKFKNEEFEKISDEIREELYEKYLVKCEVFQRDSFKCQNMTCKVSDNPLTIHHVKWQKNGGKYTSRNCVLLCQSCHKNYHRGKFAIVFDKNAEHLPSHIRGHTFKLEHADEINWKTMKAEMKKIRKTLKYDNKISRINFDMLERLMKMFEEWFKD